MLSMLFNLILPNITIFLRVVFNSFFTVSVVIKFELAIPPGVQITVANEAIDIPPLVADKTI